MAEKKFEMRQKTESGYDTFYPRTTIDQVNDLQATLNSKVDTTTNQTVGGIKTFTSQTHFRNDVDIQNKLEVESTNGTPLHLYYTDAELGVGAIHAETYNSETQSYVDSILHFSNAGEGQYDIRLPNKSGTLATTDDASGGILEVDTLPAITEDNNKMFAREDYVNLHYPQGTGIIEGEGERNLNTAGNTGNKQIEFLINDFNGIGKNFIDNITLSEEQGFLRGSNPPTFKPFWTIGGYEISGGYRGALFTFNEPITSITIHMTTGFSVATGGTYEGLIPSDYPEIHISNNVSSSTAVLDSVNQGDDPNNVTINEYTIDNGDSFDSVELKWLNAEGSTLASTKINIYKIEVTFEDGSTVYAWDQLADVNYVNTVTGVVATDLATETSTRSLETSSLDVRVTTNEDNINELQDYVGEIQFEHVNSSLPTAGPSFVNKVFRYNKKFYQCYNTGTSEFLEGNFAPITGTSAIVVDSCDDVELCWNRKVKVKTSTRAYRNNGNIKLSSSSALGSIEIRGLTSEETGEDETFINKMTIQVKPWVTTSGGKPSILTIQKTVDGTTSTILNQQELSAGTTSYSFDFTGLGLGDNDYLTIKSDSFATSQDRRLLIEKISLTIGQDNYIWSDICHGSGSSSSNIFINPYNTDNTYVLYFPEDETTITCSYNDEIQWFVDDGYVKIPEKYIFNRNQIWLLNGTQIKDETTDTYIDFATLTTGTTLIARNDGITVKSIPVLALQYKAETSSHIAVYQFIPIYSESVMLMPRISGGNVYCQIMEDTNQNRLWDPDHKLYFTIKVDEGEVVPGDEIVIGVYKYKWGGKNHNTGYHRFIKICRYEIQEADLQTHFYKNQRLIRISLDYCDYISALKRTYDASGQKHTKTIRIGRPIYRGGNRVDTVYSNDVNYNIIFNNNNLPVQDGWWVRAHLI